MKYLAGLFLFASLIIAYVMLTLVRGGVALRTAPLIRPSVIHPEQENVARSVVSRLYPDLRATEVLYWGVPSEGDTWNELRGQLARHYEKILGAVPHIMDLRSSADSIPAQAEAVRLCPKPCWVVLLDGEAHFLSQESQAYKLDQLVARPALTLTLIRLQRNLEIPEQCIPEKRISRACLPSVATKDSARKFKDPNAKYFFLRRYNDRDHFLFVEF